MLFDLSDTGVYSNLVHYLYRVYNSLSNVWRKTTNKVQAPPQTHQNISAQSIKTLDIAPQRNIMTKSEIQQAIDDQDLPKNFIDTVNRWYRPISDGIARVYAKGTTTITVGVQGCQGSGKSTLSEFLKILLKSDHQLNSAVLSIDDFYLTKNERISLSANIHPLLATRGVPGTHDVQLALDTIRDLKNLKTDCEIKIPRFDKARDDRVLKEKWPPISGPVDVIILEGWCVGLNAQAHRELAEPVNQLEIEEDSESTWRHYVNKKLADDYSGLFRDFDVFVVLKAPSFSSVYEWRLLQETKLIAKNLSSTTTEIPNHTMSPEQIRRFISHYQRLTEHALLTLPERADWLLTLSNDHSITSIYEREASGNIV